MLCIALPVVAANEFAADYSADASLHLTRLRHDLLIGNTSTYDPTVAPTGRDANYSAAGTDVSMEVRFFKVQAVKGAPFCRD